MSAPYRPDDSTDPLSAVAGGLLGTFTVAAFAYLGALGFAGGTVPLLGWELPGGALPGLAWLLLLATGGLVALWFVPLMAAMALCAVVGRVRPAAIAAVRRPSRLFRPLKQAA